jgi:hypothetical protein
MVDNGLTLRMAAKRLEDLIWPGHVMISAPANGIAILSSIITRCQDIGKFDDQI